MGKVTFRESSPEIVKRPKIERIVERQEEKRLEDEEDEDEELRSHLGNVPEEIIREIIRYRDTLHEVGPYKIDFRPNYPLIGGVVPMTSEQFPRQYKSAMTCLQLAIDQYNNHNASNLELHKVVRANITPSTAYHYYITFEAKDKVSGQIDVYCTRVWDDAVDERITVQEFFKENDAKGAADLLSSSKTGWKV